MMNYYGQSDFTLMLPEEVSEQLKRTFRPTAL